MMVFVYSLLIATGLLLVLMACTVNLMVDQLIENTMISVAYGEPLSNYLLEILAVMSGGTILIVPIWFQLTLGAVGCLALWIGVQGIIFRSEGVSIKVMLTKEYWIQRQKSFKYDPYA